MRIFYQNAFVCNLNSQLVHEGSINTQICLLVSSMHQLCKQDMFCEFALQILSSIPFPHITYLNIPYKIQKVPPKHIIHKLQKVTNIKSANHNQNYIQYLIYLQLNFLPLTKYLQQLEWKCLQKASIMFNSFQNPLPPNNNTAQLNNQMVPRINLIDVLEKQLSSISQENILLLCRKIFPVQISTPNVYNSFYKTFMQYFSIQSTKGLSYDIVVSDVAKTAFGINQSMGSKISEVFKKEDIRSKFIEIQKKKLNLGNNQISQQAANFQNNGGPFAKKVNPSSSTLLENLGQKYGNQSTHKYGNLLNKQLNESFKKDPPTFQSNHPDISNLIADKYMKQKNVVDNLLNKITLQKQLSRAGNMKDKKCLMCDNNFIEGTLNDRKVVFQCKDCQQIYHKKCMIRDNNCSFCQLSNLNPLNRVKAPLFVGILKKGVKRHEIQFQVTKSQYSMANQSIADLKNPKKTQSLFSNIEIRSLRAKQTNDPVANFINLFPDACTVLINSRPIKQFQPLHKQSSLKFRRDQSLKVINNINVGLNKIVITERIYKKEVKSEQRVIPQNHFIGIYIVQSLHIPKAFNKIEDFFVKSGYATQLNSVQKFLENLDSRYSDFYDSKQLLRSSLMLNEGAEGTSSDKDEEVSCQSIKVSIVCSLSLQKMKYPGRTIFCRHFGCFDIYNYLLLNSQAKLPKWQCPICKVSAYKFEIDCILNSIIKEIGKTKQKKFNIKQNEEPSEIEFDSKMNIKFLNADGKVLICKDSKKSTISPQIAKKLVEEENAIESDVFPFWIKHIQDLPIEGKNKRVRKEFVNPTEKILKKEHIHEDIEFEQLQVKDLIIVNGNQTVGKKITIDNSENSEIGLQSDNLKELEIRESKLKDIEMKNSNGPYPELQPFNIGQPEQKKPNSKDGMMDFEVQIQQMKDRATKDKNLAEENEKKTIVYKYDVMEFSFGELQKNKTVYCQNRQQFQEDAQIKGNSMNEQKQIKPCIQKQKDQILETQKLSEQDPELLEAFRQYQLRKQFRKQKSMLLSGAEKSNIENSNDNKGLNFEPRIENQESYDLKIKEGDNKMNLHRDMKTTQSKEDPLKNKTIMCPLEKLGKSTDLAQVRLNCSKNEVKDVENNMKQKQKSQKGSIESSFNKSYTPSNKQKADRKSTSPQNSEKQIGKMKSVQQKNSKGCTISNKQQTITMGSSIGNQNSLVTRSMQRMRNRQNNKNRQKRKENENFVIPENIQIVELSD